MSKHHLKIEITTPQGQAYLSEDIDKIILPGKHGLITVLPRHIDICVTLTKGDLIVYGLKCENECEHFIVSGGFAQIEDNYNVTILTEHLEKKEE